MTARRAWCTSVHGKWCSPAHRALMADYWAARHAYELEREAVTLGYDEEIRAYEGDPNAARGLSEGRPVLFRAFLVDQRRQREAAEAMLADTG